MVVSERVEWPSPHSFIYSSLRFTPRSREVQLVELETTTPTLSHLPLVAHIFHSVTETHVVSNLTPKSTGLVEVTFKLQLS